MRGAKHFFEGYRQGAESRFTAVAVTGLTYRIGVHERVVLVEESNLDNVIVYLPPVKEAEGQLFSIIKIGAAAKAITIKNSGDSLNWSDNTSCDAQYDRVVYYSDGFAWHLLAQVTN